MTLVFYLILLLSITNITNYFNYSNAGGLDIFPNLKILILDHNNFTNIVSLPTLSKLETLSLSYNAIRD